MHFLRPFRAVGAVAVRACLGRLPAAFSLPPAVSGRVLGLGELSGCSNDVLTPYACRHVFLSGIYSGGNSCLYPVSICCLLCNPMIKSIDRILKTIFKILDTHWKYFHVPSPCLDFPSSLLAGGAGRVTFTCCLQTGDCRWLAVLPLSTSKRGSLGQAKSQ